jgi:FdhD protein
MKLPSPIVRVQRLAWHGSELMAGERAIPEETAVSFTYNRIAQAVMMATPADLEDFAVGFSLSEGLIASAGDIEELEIVPQDKGVELRMTIVPGARDAFVARRRLHAGPAGCGLCGIESLDQAMRSPPPIASEWTTTVEQIAEALDSIAACQKLNHETHAIHAAGYWEPNGGLIALREDVGRHNALDKLHGALVRKGVAAARGILVMTSRVSVELVQKAAAMGAPLLVAVSAPTALALRMAEAAGLTLVGVARPDGFEIFTHAERIERMQVHDVA